MITPSIAQQLRPGDELTHKVRKRANGMPETVTVYNDAVLWPSRPERFRIPVTWNRSACTITEANGAEWNPPQRLVGAT